MGPSLLTRRVFFAGVALWLGDGDAQGEAAGNVSIASYTLREVAQGWALDVDVPVELMRVALTKKYGDVSRASEQATRRMVSAYIRANVRLYFDGRPARFLAIGFTAPGRSNKMRCELSALAPGFEKVRAELLAFNEVASQQSLFEVESQEGKSRIVVSNATGFVAEWTRGEARFESMEASEQRVRDPGLEQDEALGAPQPGEALTSTRRPGCSAEYRRAGLTFAALLGAVGVALVFRRRANSKARAARFSQPGG